MVKAKAAAANRIAGGNGDGPATAEEGERVTITAPNFKTAGFTIRGTSAFVQNKFSEKAREIMRLRQEEGSTGKKGRKQDPKDFEECYQAAQYRTAKGENGIPANSIRASLIEACTLVDMFKTVARKCLWVEEDGHDGATGLVFFSSGKPEMSVEPVRLDSGTTDLRARPMWAPGWTANVRIRFDADRFTVRDVTNLLMRAGMQVGIGEGRPASKKSNGVGWGLFEVIQG